MTPKVVKVALIRARESAAVGLLLSDFVLEACPARSCARSLTVLTVVRGF